ncbi:hypothetical protein [Mesorhizobium sp. KR1-2]|uniref:hypothetical protein n=1 Tax=Mesorhizobium sp. KR1-2 TaxID=3156609 RepID=UPI0032B3C6BD
MMMKAGFPIAATAGGLFLAMAGTAGAGNGNKLYLLQEKTFGTEGNTLSVDQSQANDSIIRGLVSGQPATQKGSGNRAELTIDGNGGRVQLLQNNSISGGAGNSAVVNLSGNALAILGQVGAGNTANLSVAGELAQGSIFQTGKFNNADLSVSGNRAKGLVTQIGNNITTGLSVTGTGTTVSYTVNGNNVTNAPGGGVQVYTNGAAVSITQTTFP